MNSPTGPKRVLLSADAVGGIWPYTIELARALSRRRVAVEIAVLGPRVTAEQARTVAAIPGARLHETGLPLDWTAAEPAALAIASNTLASLAQHLAVETVQLHTPALVAQSIWHAPVLAVIHSCVGTWWNAVREDALPEDFRWRVAAVRAGLTAAEAVVAPSRAFAAMVRSTYGLGRGIAVVHNGRAPAGLGALIGITASANPPSPKADRVAHEAVIPMGTLGVRDATARHGVLAAGRLWDEGKNIALLDRAAAVMGAVPVMAAGALHGPNGAGLTLSRLRALGVLDDAAMARTMAEARVFAAPALYEPFGLAVLEAAQAGLPLVLSDIPSFRELWDGAAIFLPPQNAEVWGAALSALHAEPAACRRWGMKARVRAATYTVERFDGAMWEMHCQLLAQARRAVAAA